MIYSDLFHPEASSFESSSSQLALRWGNTNCHWSVVPWVYTSIDWHFPFLQTNPLILNHISNSFGVLGTQPPTYSSLWPILLPYSFAYCLSSPIYLPLSMAPDHSELPYISLPTVYWYCAIAWLNCQFCLSNSIHVLVEKPPICIPNWVSVHILCWNFRSV